MGPGHQRSEGSMSTDEVPDLAGTCGRLRAGLGMEGDHHLGGAEALIAAHRDRLRIVEDEVCCPFILALPDARHSITIPRDLPPWRREALLLQGYACWLRKVR
jgi:hypothetical protein